MTGAPVPEDAAPRRIFRVPARLDWLRRWDAEDLVETEDPIAADQWDQRAWRRDP